MTNDPRTLRRLHDELRTLAATLTDKTERTYIRDDRSVTRHQGPSLLKQLRDAVGTGTESGRAGRGRGIPLPIDVTATDMLAQIEADVIHLHLEALKRDGYTTEDRIKALVRIATRWAEPDAVGAAVNHLRKLAAEITNLLDPPRRPHFAAPCPACDTRMVKRLDPATGDIVQIPALSYDPDRGAVCLNKQCGHVWPHGNLELLAKVIGCDPIREDLEAAG